MTIRIVNALPAISALASLTDVNATTIADKRTVRWDSGTGKLTFKDPLIVDATDYGVVADCVTVTDGAITTGTAALSSATAAFTSADVGKRIEVRGAGVSGATLATTIQALVNSTQVTLTVTAGTTVTGARVTYGTDCAAGLRAAVTYAAGLASRPGVGVVLVLPRGRLMLAVTNASNPALLTSYKLGIPVPVNLAGHLTIRGQGGFVGARDSTFTLGSAATTLVCTDECPQVFFPNTTNSATAHISTTSGQSTATVLFDSIGTLKAGQMIFPATFTASSGIPASTIVGSRVGNSITLRSAADGTTAVNATATSSDMGVALWSKDTWQNLTFEGFVIDNNQTTGRADLIGSRPGGNGSMFYLSFNNIAFRDVHAFNVPYDGTTGGLMPVTNKALIGMCPLHPADDGSSAWQLRATNIRVEDCVGLDVQNGIRIASYLGLAMPANSWFDNIVLRNTWIDHVFTNPRPADWLQQTTYFICGSGKGGTAKFIDCGGRGSGDDGIEVGAMQRIVIERPHFIDNWFTPLAFRHTQDPPDMKSQEITVTDGVLEWTPSFQANITAPTNPPWARPCRFLLDSTSASGGNGLGVATGWGRVKLRGNLMKLDGLSFSKLSKSSENDIGWNVQGKIQRVDFDSNKCHVNNFTYDSASVGVWLAGLVANITPDPLDPAGTGTARVQASPAVFSVRDFDMVVEGGSTTAGGNCIWTGVHPVGDGVFDVNGLDVKIHNFALTSGGASGVLAALGRGGTPRLIRLRRMGGARFSSGFGYYGVRIFNSFTAVSSTLSKIVIDDNDFASFASALQDIEMGSAPGTIGQWLYIGRNNRWQLNGTVADGGYIKTGADLTLTAGASHVGVTNTSALRTITLPAISKWPWGIDHAILVTDETGNASVNTIVVKAAGSDTIVGGTTSTTKVINTNGGSARFYTNGTNVIVAA